MDQPDITPKNVELWDWDDHNTLRRRIFDGVQEEMKNAFPASYGGVRVELDKLEYKDPELYSTKEQKEALLKDKFLARRLRGTLRMYDEATGELLEEKATTLARVPWLTPRGTFIHGGNEYTVSSQSRLLPGIYTRKRESGEVETHFNVKRGTGSAFRVMLEPDTAQYRMRVQSANLHLYSLLHDLGVSDEDLAARWGTDILERNRRKYDSRVLDKTYERLVPSKLRPQDGPPDQETKAQLVKDALAAMQVNAAVARRNLPNLFGRVKFAAVVEHDPEVEHFMPELPAEEALDQYFELTKVAGDDWDPADTSEKALREFVPELGMDDLQEDASVLYGRTGPRLAGMKKWPDKWLPPGTNQLGWLAWYADYANGKRSTEDDWQIKRWKAFRARHLPQFKKHPTARRAYMLRLWALDPLKHLDDKTARRIQQEMETLKARETEKWQLRKEAFAAGDYRALAAFLNQEHQAGVNAEGTVDEMANQTREFLAEQGQAVTPPAQAQPDTLGLQDMELPDIKPIGSINMNEAIKFAEDGSSFDPDDAEDHINLGLDSVLAATEKVLAVNRGMAEPDDRDNIRFKRLMTPDKLFRERVRLDADKLRYSFMRHAARHRNLNGAHAFVFDKYTEGQIVQNMLASPLEEINPLQLFEQRRRVTQMGPGGLGSDDAITDDMRAIHPSQFGYISPLEGPECFDDQSEVYTKRGWTPWPEVRDDDEFRCRVTGGYVQYERADRIVRTAYKGTLLAAENTSLRMCVTPNHRVLLAGDGTEWIDRADAVVGTTIAVPVTVGQAYSAAELVHVAAEDWKTVDYDGMVYCATVPGGLLYVRGNKVTSGFWSGNSGRAGIDVRMAWGTRVGSDGRIYQRYHDRRTGRYAWLSPEDMDGKVIALPA